MAIFRFSTSFRIGRYQNRCTLENFFFFNFLLRIQCCFDSLKLGAHFEFRGLLQVDDDKYRTAWCHKNSTRSPKKKRHFPQYFEKTVFLAFLAKIG
ncbi:MAG: hypothetical protein GY820_44415 [Gammaproteobacteria bacterium]|nr:hypothetical protein [Gammaproteobacteria bacterium]